MSKDEAIAQLNGPLGTEVRNVSAYYAVPFVWGNPASKEPQILRNGSAFFVRWGDVAFAVTANHVYDEYLTAATGSQQIVCQLGTNLKINPVERLIDRSTDPDIATFLVTDKEIRQAGKWAFSMPAFVPEVGKGVFFRVFRSKPKRRLEQQPISLASCRAWS